MMLSTDGTSISIRRGSVSLRVGAATGRDSNTGMILEVEYHEPYALVELELKLEPWSPDGYDVYDWEWANVLVVSGAGRVAAVGLSAPHTIAAMGLEYEEAETLDAPWFVEMNTTSLVVATERRVWCIDAGPSIRWCWNVRNGAEDRWVCGTPLVDATAVVVPVRSRSGQVMTRVSIRDGSIE